MFSVMSSAIKLTFLLCTVSQSWSWSHKLSIRFRAAAGRSENHDEDYDIGGGPAVGGDLVEDSDDHLW